MSSIFVNYRKNPHGTAVAAIADALQSYFGAEEVFIDNGIPSGDRYPATLELRLQTCTVLIVVIHEGWVDAFKVPRRKDWVLHEIKSALDRGIHVIPVPIGDAVLPTWEELPAEIGELAQRQAAPIRAAGYSADLNGLIRQLENHVVPAAAPSESTAPRKQRIWLRLLLSTVSLVVLTPVLFYSGGTTWELLARPAAISTLALALVSTLVTTLIFPMQPLITRLEKRAGASGVQGMFKRYWIVPFLILLASVFPSIHSISQDDDLTEGKIFFFIAFFSVSLWVLWVWFLRTAERDEEWPPPVTTHHADFRRAAHRLERRLLEIKNSRRPGTQADRRDAELIVSRLDGAREELDLRARASIPAWVRRGYRPEAIAYLSWFASIVALDATAAGIGVFAEPVLGHPLLAAGRTIAIAAVFTAAALCGNCLLDRRNARRWSAEITEWQAKLAAMIREQGAPAERGHE